MASKNEQIDFSGLDLSKLGELGLDVKFSLAPDILRIIDDLANEHKMTRGVIMQKMFNTGFWVATATKTGDKFIIKTQNKGDLEVNIFTPDDKP